MSIAAWKKPILFLTSSAVFITTIATGWMPSVYASSVDASKNEQKTKKIESKANKYTGKDVRVAIIDSGTDMNHPLFKGRIAKAYDFVDRDHNPQDEKGHGTHVAGIVAQQAPGAQFLLYRALGESKAHSHSNDVVSAIKQAVIDGADVINLSLGTDVNAPDEPVSMAIADAVSKGVVVVKSAGNNGVDKWQLTAPGYREEPIVVGATTLSRVDSVLTKGKDSIHLYPVYGVPSMPTAGVASFVYKGNVSPEKLKKDKALKNKIVVVELEDSFTPVDELYLAAQEAGAAGILLSNPEIQREEPAGNMTRSKLKNAIPAAVMTHDDAKKLRLQSGSGWKWSSTKVKERVSDMSSRGPAAGTWLMKPDLVAPGINIRSAVPFEVAESGYSLWSGTSMAAPHVSAAAAILLEAHPEWTPSQIKSALMQQADQLTDEKGKLYERAAQGAGLLNVERALEASTLVTPSSLSFGRVAPQAKGKSQVIEKTLTLTNSSDQAVTYELSVQNETVPEKLQFEMPKSVTVGPKETIDVPIKWTVSLQQQKGIWTGSIIIKANSNNQRVPFMLVYKMNDYPLVMGLFSNTSLYSPYGKKEMSRLSTDYYVSVPSDRVLLTATRFDESQKSLHGKTYIWLSEKNHKSGLFNYVWNGQDINGAKLPDGAYLIKAKSFAENRQTVQEGEIVYIDQQAPKIVNINKSKAAKGQLYGKLSDLSIQLQYLITSNMESMGISNEPIVKMQWSPLEQDKWRAVHVNVESGNFFATLQKQGLKPGKHKVKLLMQDVLGNKTVHITEVTVK
ncbi:S8 family serine peptidase [Paenibacillus sp. 481]|uniref:S8 family serine peptidase n=1 Tax=Paenibacillus sp. 481 TaxID=2835869 RepID=UPI001E59EE9D|nr:S8 family serine peptidase [Paenibacillus sp. 481]UHA75370.1 S8 family serine peptidase [Paenibacillus sp. 481]